MRFCRHIAPVVFSAVLAVTADGQVVRGRIIEAGTRLPVPLAEARLLGENDVSLDLTVTSDSGTFVLRGAGRAKYSVDIRRVGFHRLTTTHITLAPGDTMTIALEIERVSGISLDTVRIRERSSWWTSATPGRTWVRQHAQRGIGVFIAGSLIERSGMSLSEYLGKLEGLSLTSVLPRGMPVVPARGGLFVTSTFPSRCLYARVDRQSLAHYLISTRLESIDEALKLNQIAAIEIYRDRSEIPDEWKDAGFVQELFYRKNNGIEYVIGHPSNTLISDGMISEDAFGARSATRGMVTDARTEAGNLNNARVDMTALVTRENLATPQCGLLQIWTARAW